jgi:hypothetical protein
MTAAVEALTFDTTIVHGRQFISPNFLMPWAPKLAVVKKDHDVRIGISTLDAAWKNGMREFLLAIC